MTMWFDDDKDNDGFPGPVEDSVFAIAVLAIAAGLAMLARLLFWSTPT